MMKILMKTTPKKDANERQRVSLASGAGRGAPASEPVGGSGGEAPGLIGERERDDIGPRRDCHVLPAIEHVSHR